MSIEELSDNFKKWNPMKNDYKNTKFNQYVSGPGAELDSELQIGQKFLQTDSEKKGQQKQQPVPSLIFRNLPKDMTKKAMINICSKHGRVTAVRDSTKNTYYFVDLATVADMESVLRGLEKNDYGFTVGVARSQNKKSSDSDKNINKQNIAPVPPRNTGIDYENRSYRTSNKNHPRPKVKKESSLLNTKEAANKTGLPLKLLADDAHSLERQGLDKTSTNNKFNYRHGRSYVKMPEKTKNFIDKKHKESSGHYNESAGKYIHSPEIDLMPNLEKCSVCYYACDNVCSRCAQKYYCSVECQMKDWPQHRYKCGKPNHLQENNATQKQNQTSNKTPETSKEQNQNVINIQTSKTSAKNSQQNQQTNSQQELPCCSKNANNNNNKTNSSPQQINKNHTTNSNNNKNSKNSINSKNSSSSLTQTTTNSKLSSTSSSATTKEDVILKNMPRSGNIVTITTIIKSNVVFIRSKTYDDNINYFNTIDTLQAIGGDLKPLKSLPQSSEMVIAKFENQFNRGLVCNIIDANKIIIHFVDYGNMEYMKLQDLYEIPIEFANKPRHAIPVLLKDVPNIYMTQEIRKFMYTYLNNINVEIRYKPEDFQQENNVFAVELIDENTQLNINQMIVKLSKPVEPKNIEEICERGYLAQKSLPGGDDVELIVMDNSLMFSGGISCTTRAYAIEIEKFQVELQKYAESLPKEAYTPRSQELCIARYDVDGLWYRGLCMETVGDGYPSIQFIDYGNITPVPIEDIRRYPRQFTFPIYTADCDIKGLPESCDDNIVAKLEELIPNGKSIKCAHVEAFEEDNYYIISLPNVIKELIDNGLIKNDDEHV